MLMDSGASDTANYQGKTLVQWAHLFKDNDKVGEMVWDHLKTKHGISDNHFSKGGPKKGGKKRKGGSDLEDEFSDSDEGSNYLGGM